MKTFPNILISQEIYLIGPAESEIIISLKQIQLFSID